MANTFKSGAVKVRPRHKDGYVLTEPNDHKGRYVLFREYKQGGDVWTLRDTHTNKEVPNFPRPKDLDTAVNWLANYLAGRN